VVSSVNSSLINYLSAKGLDGNVANALASKSSGSTGTLQAQRQQALQRAAGTAKGVNAAQALDTAQKALAKDLRSAMSQAGVKLTGAIEFTVKSDGSVDMKGTDADKAAEEPRQPRPLNALGARLATVALRMGLARLLEIHPRTDTGRRWGVVHMPTKAERQEAALQVMREDAMIAKAVESMRDKAPAPGGYIAEDDAQLLGERLAKLDDNAIHITDK
jgi:hypothetical protein